MRRIGADAPVNTVFPGLKERRPDRMRIHLQFQLQRRAAEILRNLTQPVFLEDCQQLHTPGLLAQRPEADAVRIQLGTSKAQHVLQKLFRLGLASQRASEPVNASNWPRAGARRRAGLPPPFCVR